uniref:Uncharacterized protein n=1 Tax=Rhizophagus irregularis (strain DAOM 181602 / DAOM 197198 / MUCL 43194) TaxID=747089 RepID=U9TPT3_RHIID
MVKKNLFGTSHPQFLFGFIADGNSSSIHIIEHEFVGLPGFSVSSEVTMMTGLEVMIVVGFIVIRFVFI